MCRDCFSVLLLACVAVKVLRERVPVSFSHIFTLRLWVKSRSGPRDFVGIACPKGSEFLQQCNRSMMATRQVENCIPYLFLKSVMWLCPRNKRGLNLKPFCSLRHAFCCDTTAVAGKNGRTRSSFFELDVLYFIWSVLGCGDQPRPGNTSSKEPRAVTLARPIWRKTKRSIKQTWMTHSSF